MDQRSMEQRGADQRRADIQLCDLALSKVNPDLAEVFVLFEASKSCRHRRLPCCWRYRLARWHRGCAAHARSFATCLHASNEPCIMRKSHEP